jgi:hypothetical protein
MLTLKGMLEMGKACGLDHLEEAYSNVMQHYDAFFTIESNEMRDFQESLKDSPLTQQDENDLCTIADLTIDEALALLEKTEKDLASQVKK